MRSPRATPLDLVKEGLRTGRPFAEIRSGSLFGDFGGRGWEWVANLIALGGLYLLYTGTIRWHIPPRSSRGLLIPATVFYLVDPNGYATARASSASAGHACSAHSSSPPSPSPPPPPLRGRLIYGAGIGLLAYVLRTWGAYPDGVAFSVLLMNGAVPLINRYTRPRDLWPALKGSTVGTMLRGALARRGTVRRHERVRMEPRPDRAPTNARVVARAEQRPRPGVARPRPDDDALSVTDTELLGSDDPVDVFVIGEAGAPVAVLFASVAPHGYNAAINLLVGVSPAGNVTGVRAVRHRETARLGDAIDAAKKPVDRAVHR